MSDDEKLFIVHWPKRRWDAQEPVICRYCRRTWFTSEENARAAKEAGMEIACMRCLVIIAEKEEVQCAGRIRNGRVIESGGDA